LRFLILILAIWLGVMILRYFYRKRVSSQNKPTLKTEHMVRCESCGVHVPQTDACQYGKKWFCSSQHMQSFIDKHE